MQISFDELGVPLRDVVFVVVDLETTGGSPASSGITEIGAVKVRGGEVLGELHTLVNPRELIPPFIAVLTGITDAMVATAPHIETVLPAFLDFARGCVLVAHNAPFDLGFLKAACESLGLRLARLRFDRHRATGASRAHQRRGAELQAVHARPRVARISAADAPRARRRACHRRRPACVVRTARQPRCAFARRVAHVHRHGHRRSNAASATSLT